MAFLRGTGRQRDTDDGSVFRGGGVPAGGFTDGPEIADDDSSRYEQDEPEKDPQPEQNPGLPSGTPTTMPISDPGPVLKTPPEETAPPKREPEPDISLPGFTPGTGINGPADKNGGTDKSAETNNTKDKNKTDAVAGKELNATMQAQGSASNDEATPSAPWWDPFGWTTSTGSDTGTDEGPPVGILAAIGAALVVFYMNN